MRRLAVLRICVGLWLAALVLPAHVVADGPITARLSAKGEVRAGAPVEVKVELAWSGRPETLLPDLPTVRVPEGASLRLGPTSSSFDGERTRWWTTGTLTLPERPPPYTIGPATAFVRTPEGSRQSVTAAAVILGGKGGKAGAPPLVGQAAGSAVLLVIGAFVLRRVWRSAGADPLRGPREALPALVDAAKAQAPRGDANAFFALERLRLALDPLHVDHLDLPTAAALRERGERIGNGVEGADPSGCWAALVALAAAVAVARGEPLRL